MFLTVNIVLVLYMWGDKVSKGCKGTSVSGAKELWLGLTTSCFAFLLVLCCCWG